MNTIARLTAATLLVAALAAAVLVQAPSDPVAAPADVVVTLPQVQVIARRAAPADVVLLPTVTVTARRDAATTLLAQRATPANAF
jgi:hypothetical protein